MDKLTGERFIEDPLITKEEFDRERMADKLLIPRLVTFEYKIGQPFPQYKNEMEKYFPQFTKEKYIDTLMEWYGDKIPKIFKKIFYNSSKIKADNILSLNWIYSFEREIFSDLANYIITSGNSHLYGVIYRYREDPSFGFIDSVRNINDIMNFLNIYPENKEGIYDELHRIYNMILEKYYKEEKWEHMRARQEKGYRELISELKRKMQ
jgi:hypothetical protein